jgi:TM2 domain-containing membrane protein YozV
MKSPVKAALLSGLVFPGLGQIYLKRYMRGLTIIIPVILGLMLIIGMATIGALEILKKIQAEGGNTDMDTILNLATTYSTPNAIYSDIIFLFIACCWLFSVIDAYRLGKRNSLNIRDGRDS